MIIRRSAAVTGLASAGIPVGLHLLVVAATGSGVITYSAVQLQQIQAPEWLVIPLTLLLVNLAEYVAHRWLGHRKTRLGRMFYARHTGDHHSFFVETAMPFESTRDWRVVLFPAWLIYVFLLGLMLPGGWSAAAAVVGQCRLVVCRRRYRRLSVL